MFFYCLHGLYTVFADLFFQQHYPYLLQVRDAMVCPPSEAAFLGHGVVTSYASQDQPPQVWSVHFLSVPEIQKKLRRAPEIKSWFRAT